MPTLRSGRMVGRYPPLIEKSICRNLADLQNASRVPKSDSVQYPIENYCAHGGHQLIAAFKITHQLSCDGTAYSCPTQKRSDPPDHTAPRACAHRLVRYPHGRYTPETDIRLRRNIGRYGPILLKKFAVARADFRCL